MALIDCNAIAIAPQPLIVPSAECALATSLPPQAKYEAWKKLGTMNKAEAMHLYVQAIEVFDEHWLEWRGLQGAVAAAVGMEGGVGRRMRVTRRNGFRHEGEAPRECHLAVRRII